MVLKKEKWTSRTVILAFLVIGLIVIAAILFSELRNTRSQLEAQTRLVQEQNDSIRLISAERIWLENRNRELEIEKQVLQGNITQLQIDMQRLRQELENAPTTNNSLVPKLNMYDVKRQTEYAGYGITLTLESLYEKFGKGNTKIVTATITGKNTDTIKEDINEALFVADRYGHRYEANWFGCSFLLNPEETKTNDCEFYEVPVDARIVSIRLGTREMFQVE